MSHGLQLASITLFVIGLSKYRLGLLHCVPLHCGLRWPVLISPVCRMLCTAGEFLSLGLCRVASVKESWIGYNQRVPDWHSWNVNIHCLLREIHCMDKCHFCETSVNYWGYDSQRIYMYRYIIRIYVTIEYHLHLHHYMHPPYAENTTLTIVKIKISQMI